MRGVPAGGERPCSYELPVMAVGALVVGVEGEAVEALDFGGVEGVCVLQGVEVAAHADVVGECAFRVGIADGLEEQAQLNVDGFHWA